MSRCTFHDLHQEKASDSQHIRLISEGGCTLSRSPGPICIDSIQVTQTCTTESHHAAYRSPGALCPVFAGNSLFSIPSEHATELDRRVLPEVLRARFAQQGIELSEQTEVQVQHEGTLWVVNDRGRSYTVRRLPAFLVIFREGS